VVSGKHDTRSHNIAISGIDFSIDILFNVLFKFKYSKIVELSCKFVGIDPSTFEPSINQLSKCFKVFCPSSKKKK
jgi:hypothetical protein